MVLVVVAAAEVIASPTSAGWSEDLFIGNGTLGGHRRDGYRGRHRKYFGAANRGPNTVSKASGETSPTSSNFI